jgi:hypothetical protein
LILFDGDPEPRKHHVVQVWRTPYLTADVSEAKAAQTFLSKIGNAEIVRAMAECRGVMTLLAKDDSFSGLYVELVRSCGDIADSYFWVGNAEAHNLKSALTEIKTTAEAADKLSAKCVAFLLKPEALDPYGKKSPSSRPACLLWQKSRRRRRSRKHWRSRAASWKCSQPSSAV